MKHSSASPSRFDLKIFPDHCGLKFFSQAELLSFEVYPERSGPRNYKPGQFYTRSFFRKVFDKNPKIP